jgi:hypothetical protein
MPTLYLRQWLLAVITLFFICPITSAQTSFKLKYNNSTVFTGIEVGSKGVKMSMVEIGKNAQSRGDFNILKDTSVNTDFISFSQPTFQATLDALCSLYDKALKEYGIPDKRVFTVTSSGVKMQAEKEGKTQWVNTLIDSFRRRINEPARYVEVVDVLQEARLSHLGIVPDSRRYTTFLIDIGSGNTKGGYFPYGNTKDFKLFQINWGTKSTANEVEKRCEDDKSVVNFNRHLPRVLSAAENSEIIYAVNESGSYPLSDNIAISGGIAWAVATLSHPELIDNSVVPVTYEEIVKFSEQLYSSHTSFSDAAVTAAINDPTLDKTNIGREVKRVNQVFDQKSLMAGTGLLLKIMRQFKSIYESKQFYLVKNGQVGWISAYVDQHINK